MQNAQTQYKNRRNAGAELGRALRRRADDLPDLSDAVVLGLARGGVPVAVGAAQALRLPLDVLVVRKLGVPGMQEVALGAITSGGGRYLNRDMARRAGVTDAMVDRIEAREREELARREEAYRKDREPLELSGRTVILCDDGVATGASMSAALKAMRAASPARIVIAVPVASPDAGRLLRSQADDVVILQEPAGFVAVGAYYRDFGQTSDDEVIELLSTHAGSR